MKKRKFVIILLSILLCGLVFFGCLSKYKINMFTLDGNVYYDINKIEITDDDSGWYVSFVIKNLSGKDYEIKTLKAELDKSDKSAYLDVNKTLKAHDELKVTFEFAQYNNPYINIHEYYNNKNDIHSYKLFHRDDTINSEMPDSKLILIRYAILIGCAVLSIGDIICIVLFIIVGFFAFSRSNFVGILFKISYLENKYISS